MQQCMSNNSVNCWDISLRQSAAKPIRRKVQRSFRKEVGSSDPKRRAPRWGDDMILSTRRRVAAPKGAGQEVTSLLENNANAQIDGDDLSSFSAVTATARLGNYSQIMRKDFIIADNLNGAIDEAGRRSEIAYQLAKKGNELKRDMEFNFCGVNQAAVAGSTSAARKTASLSAFIRTNTNKGTGGGDPTVSNGIVNAARTDASSGNQRAFTETILKDVIQQTWTQGGEVSFLMVGPFNKQAVSAFAGIAAQRYMAPEGPTTIVGAADVYVNLGVAA